MTDYSTLGGIPTKDEAYRKLQHHLDQAIIQAQVIGHLLNTEDDNISKLKAKGWYGVGEMFQMVKIQVRQIMMARIS